MVAYDKIGIEYFNPQVDNWDPSLAEIEAQHLANDEVILFPVTNETYATGSLAEVGFSILNAISLDDRRDFVILIDPTLDESLKENAVAYKDSVRARALVKQHLIKLRLGNLYLVDTLEEMLAVSIALYEAAVIRKRFERYNPHRRTG
jgi:hypothetical protein